MARRLTIDDRLILPGKDESGVFVECKNNAGHTLIQGMPVVLDSSVEGEIAVKTAYATGTADKDSLDVYGVVASGSVPNLDKVLIQREGHMGGDEAGTTVRGIKVDGTADIAKGEWLSTGGFDDYTTGSVSASGTAPGATTLTVVLGDGTITCSSTNFLAAHVGHKITFDSEDYTIVSFTSTTVVEIDPPCKATSQSSLAYTISGELTGSGTTWTAAMMGRYLFFRENTGGVDTTEGSTAVTEGTTTAFTADHVGRWFQVVGTQKRYKIASVTDSANLVLESPYLDTAASDGAYTIQSDEMYEINSRTASTTILVDRTISETVSAANNKYVVTAPVAIDATAATGGNFAMALEAYTTDNALGNVRAILDKPARQDTSSTTHTAASNLGIGDGYGMYIGHSGQIAGSATAELQVLGTALADSSMILAAFSADAVGPEIEFVKSRHASLAGQTIVANNDVVGKVVWLPADGSDFATEAAVFSAEVDDGTPAAGDIGMAFVWDSMPGAAGGLAEVMRLSAAGDLSMADGGAIYVGNPTGETVSTGDGSTNLVPEFQVIGTTQADSTAMLACFATSNTVAPTLALVKGGHGTIGSHTAVANDEYVGRIIAFGDDGTDLETPVGEIRFVVDDVGGPSTGAIGGSIELYTTADAGETLTKALTLDNAQGAILAGNLVVGHTATETLSDGDGDTDMVPDVQFLGTTQAGGSLALMTFNTTNTIASTLAFVKGGNAAIGSHTAVADNEYLGRIIAYGDDGTDLEAPAAEIRFVVDDTPTTGQMGGSIEFLTTADAGETLTPAMTIDVNQNLLVGNGNGVVIGHTAFETVSVGDGATDLIPELQVLGTASADSSILLASFSTTATRAAAPYLALAKGGNAAVGSHTIVTDNEVVGVIAAFADDGVDLETPVGSIEFVVDDSGNPGANAVGGSLEFYTTADGGSTLTIAQTIDSVQDSHFAGNVFIGNAEGLIVGHTTQETISDTAGTNDLVPEVQILGSAQADSTLLLAQFSETATIVGAPMLAFAKGGNATIGSHTVVTANEVLGSITAFGDDGTDIEAAAAQISFICAGTPGTGDMPGGILLSTTTDAGETLTERWRIDAVGNLSSTGALTNVSADGAIVASGGIAFTDVANAWIDDATQGSGTTTTYIGTQTITTSSDKRLKKDIEDTKIAANATELLGKLRVVDFTWDDPTDNYSEFGKHSRGKYVGMIAQETIDVAPWIINAPGDSKNCPTCKAGKECEEHKDQYWFVQYEHLVPTLVKAVQELTEEVKRLKEAKACC